MTFAGIKEAQPRADLLAFLKEAAEKGGSQTVQQGGPMGGMGGMPTLETWRATTGLPWIGFWFRELLRWGTLDPLVAFALAQGLARTRDERVSRSSRKSTDAVGLMTCGQSCATIASNGLMPPATPWGGHFTLRHC